MLEYSGERKALKLKHRASRDIVPASYMAVVAIGLSLHSQLQRAGVLGTKQNFCGARSPLELLLQALKS